MPTHSPDEPAGEGPEVIERNGRRDLDVVAATPMFRQYLTAKERHRDAILLFRMGDFYEMFFEDAIVASRALELALTARGRGTANEAPMCGVPAHAAESYIARLVRLGHRVAICEQTEDP